MNCNTFHERLQQSLDRRRRPEADAELVQHTEHEALIDRDERQALSRR